MKKRSSKMSFFMSYQADVAQFVAKVSHCLARQADIDYYFHPEQKTPGHFDTHLKNAIKQSDWFILFLTEKTSGSKWQTDEVNLWIESRGGKPENLLIVNMDRKLLSVPSISEGDLNKLERLIVPDLEDKNAHIVNANEILSTLNVPAAPFDDLPLTIAERYEKDIISLYKNHKGVLPGSHIMRGYSPEWPRVSVYRDEGKYKLIDNPLDPETYGQHRRDDSAISVDARFNPALSEERLPGLELTFPEAGPRQRILSPPNTLRIAILVSGGIAPGINAVISAIIDRHRTYEREYNSSRNYSLHKVKTLGCIEGFISLCSRGGRITNLDGEKMKAWANRGGSVLPTARADQLLSKDPEVRAKLLARVVEKLRDQQIDILYVIGGEGSMRAAHAIWTVHDREFPQERLSVIGIPKTMDNDILWVWQSFGFLSAVEKARQEIIQLSTEVTSNPRVGVIQLFGSSSGYVVSHAALGSNVCDLALIPELDFNMRDVCDYMAGRLYGRRNPESEGTRSPYGLIVMAETAIPTDFEYYMEEDYVGLTPYEKEELKKFSKNSRKVLGQTPDALRSAGLKIVSRVLQQYIRGMMGKGEKGSLSPKVELEAIGAPTPYWENFRVFTNEPRHLIRSMEPTVSDVAYGIRLGTMAVDMALAGYTDCMASQWLTEYVVVPLKLVVLGRKQVPKEGIFWKTVVSKTGQIDYPSLAGNPRKVQGESSEPPT